MATAFSREDPLNLITEILDDLKRVNGKLDTLRAILSEMKLPKPTLHRCGRCHTNFHSQLDLLDHLDIVHNVPEAAVEREREWARLEALAAPTPDTSGA